MIYNLFRQLRQYWLSRRVKKWDSSIIYHLISLFACHKGILGFIDDGKFTQTVIVNGYEFHVEYNSSLNAYKAAIFTNDGSIRSSDGIWWGTNNKEELAVIKILITANKRYNTEGKQMYCS